MTSASFAILFMKIKLEWNSVIFGSIGSTLGVVLGLEFVDDLLSGNESSFFPVYSTMDFSIRQKDAIRGYMVREIS